MANLGSGNDNINIDGATGSFIDFGGTDTYTILNSLSGDVTITDNQASKINLPIGLTISDALFLSDGVQFTVNGNTVTLLGNPSLFTFIFGGTPLDPTAGTPQTFVQTAAAFGTNIPSPGAAPNSATNVGEVRPDGSVGTGTMPPPEPEATFTLSADASSVSEGATATFLLSTTNVSAGTELAYTITGVSAADVLGDLNGTVTVGVGGSANISVEIVADQLTEGSETLMLSLDNGQASASTVVLDTSVASANSYVSGLGGNGVVSDFNIEIVFEGVFSAVERAAFETAADYLSSVITGDLPDQGGIDDIRITAFLEPIDGPFDTLAFAGPTALRFGGDALPSEGEMIFDTADIGRQASEGTLATTVLHEMIHALGFGTFSGFSDNVTSGTDARFTGANAIAAYNAGFPGLSGADGLSGFGVPIDGGHWPEASFLNELLTPFLDGSGDYVSGLTIATLEDLGYDTIFDIALPGATMPQLDNFMLA